MSILRGDLARLVPDLKVSAPFSRLEKLQDIPEILFARKFYASPQDEDANPIAAKIDAQNVFLLIADGMGGSAATHVTDNGREVSEAQVVARHMHQNFADLIKYQPQIITDTTTASGLADKLEVGVLNQLFPKLESLYGSTRKSTLGGKIIKPFATTLSAVHISDRPDSTVINCAWGGDSPIFVITPNQIHSTYVEGMGDAINDDGLSLKLHTLKRGQVVLPRDEPFVVVNTSDWILKQTGDALGGALSIIQGSLGDNPDQWASNLFAEWRSHAGHGGELDDATVAFYARGKLPYFPRRSSLTNIVN